MTEIDQNIIRDVSGLYDEHYASIPKYLIITIITFGLFNLYWNYRQMQACNDLLDENEFSFFTWLLLIIVTIGLYHIYYQFKMGRAIVDIQKSMNERTFDLLPVISVLVTIFGLSIVVDCIHQNEINKLVE